MSKKLVYDLSKEYSLLNGLIHKIEKNEEYAKDKPHVLVGIQLYSHKYDINESAIPYSIGNYELNYLPASFCNSTIKLLSDYRQLIENRMSDIVAELKNQVVFIDDNNNGLSVAVIQCILYELDCLYKKENCQYKFEYIYKALSSEDYKKSLLDASQFFLFNLVEDTTSFNYQLGDIAQLVTMDGDNGERICLRDYLKLKGYYK